MRRAVDSLLIGGIVPPEEPGKKPSVFISYRRQGGFMLARHIHDRLGENGFPVFMDVQELGAGDFEQKILSEIAARDCFIIVLTNGSLDRMANMKDWLRRELTHAIDAGRTVIPVLDADFHFDDPQTREALGRLPGPLRQLTTFNAVRIPPPEYFDAAVRRLHDFLLSLEDVGGGVGTAGSSTASMVQELTNLPAPADMPELAHASKSWSGLQERIGGLAGETAGPAESEGSEPPPRRPASDPHLLVGRYRLRGSIGQGGMADVQRAYDEQLDREVAVKILHARYADDPDLLLRFRREAQSAASLNHPNIVSVHYAGDADGRPFIVMELVRGRSLRDLIRTERITAGRATEIVGDAALALSYAHEHGLIHRDIKPGNILISSDGEVKVTDFGIARAVNAETAEVFGTAAYVSPEQVQGETVDRRTDIYSLGCVLYELLTGQQPFRADSPVALAYQHVSATPEPPSHLSDESTPELDAITLKAMAKDAEDRYQTAHEFRADLESAQTRTARATARTKNSETDSKETAHFTLLDFLGGFFGQDRPVSQERRKIDARILLFIIGLWGVAVGAVALSLILSR